MNTDLTFITNEKNQNLKEKFEEKILETPEHSAISKLVGSLGLANQYDPINYEDLPEDTQKNIDKLNLKVV